jgi:hypothetical protein
MDFPFSLSNWYWPNGVNPAQLGTTTMQDVIKILIRPYDKRSHYPVTILVEWGSLPRCVREAVGYWMVLRHAGIILANWDGPLPEDYTVYVQPILEQALLEAQDEAA